ncbi:MULTISPECIES: hypothetical protein [unclassified Bacillus (in: firmicutes)]|uniref:hypothetical protein n=1 Tax=unclassified Bacillus (in: firmicutes) TaxID=185979 RepID=UPI0022827385|nr:hypothetical protein [Bacillus sp. S20C3]MCY8288930.1 hypothetical protein [Bacillus sp. N13C7]MCY8638165.1 hypothetical protein [Bacillus sp. S17B2]MCY8719527.1 hypothetical protein [Bacillus sp. S10C12M]MCY9142062.1 hypothetical protein [Bacillus sp. T9C1]
MKRKVMMCSGLFCSVFTGAFILNQYDGRSGAASDEWELYLLEHHLSTRMSEMESKDLPFGPREYIRIVNR